MKSDIAYYLLLLYITVIIHPLFPIARDWWEHAFNEVNHLSHVHKHYGNNHIEKEVAESSKENSSNKSSNSLKSEDQFNFHVLVNEYKNDYKAVFSVFKFILIKFLKLSSVVISRDGPPPKFA